MIMVKPTPLPREIEIATTWLSKLKNGIKGLKKKTSLSLMLLVHCNKAEHSRFFRQSQGIIFFVVGEPVSSSYRS